MFLQKKLHIAQLTLLFLLSAEDNHLGRLLVSDCLPRQLCEFAVIFLEDPAGSSQVRPAKVQDVSGNFHMISGKLRRDENCSVNGSCSPVDQKGTLLAMRLERSNVHDELPVQASEQLILLRLWSTNLQPDVYSGLELGLLNIQVQLAAEAPQLQLTHL